jgi:hypothetical protein
VVLLREAAAVTALVHHLVEHVLLIGALNSGADFDPDNTVPVPAGGFVRRVARTPHYDGVKKGTAEPAVIALFGIAPVEFELIDQRKPAWRQV